MAILLRSTQTGLFYVGYNRWHVYPDDAFDFQTMEQANEWIRTTQLSGVEIVQMPIAGEASDRAGKQVRSHPAA